MLGPGAAISQDDEENRPLTHILAEKLAQDFKDKNDYKDIDLRNLHQAASYYCLETGKSKTKLQISTAAFYNRTRTENLTSDLHLLLAELPFYLIVTSTADEMLANAFRIRDKEYSEARYHFRGKNPEMVAMGNSESPLVFYLCGTRKEPDSLVLTEDDLLDYIVSVVSENPSLPQNILSELRGTNKSLLFLGFGFRHWYLRLLLHVLRKLEKKDCESFALEQFSPKTRAELNSTVLFFKKSEYNIQICQHEILHFIRELQNRLGAVTDKLPETQMQDAPTIFICHASEDAAYASSLYKQLEAANFKPWIDKENLRGGDRWNSEIEKAIEKVDYFIVLQSHAIEKKLIGYVNKEIQLALDKEKLHRNKIRFIIPVRIDDSPIIEDLDFLQSIDLTNPANMRTLIKTIRRDQERRRKA